MKPRATQAKRRQEQAKQERKKEKNERRMQRREERSTRSDTPADVDPDIAHIVPGQSVEFDEFGNPIVPR